MRIQIFCICSQKHTCVFKSSTFTVADHDKKKNYKVMKKRQEEKKKERDRDRERQRQRQTDRQRQRQTETEKRYLAVREEEHGICVSLFSQVLGFPFIVSVSEYICSLYKGAYTPA